MHLLLRKGLQRKARNTAFGGMRTCSVKPGPAQSGETPNLLLLLKTENK
jgi:hypothetical protein